MKKQSAGLLLYRVNNDILQVLLVHPGGPFFQNKDAGAWSIPKGEFTDSETALDAACREFKEELGSLPEGDFEQLDAIKQKGGKTVFAWAVKCDLDVAGFKSNTFSIEWPPKSGVMREFPEIDKAEWFSVQQAMEKINAAQVGFLQQLTELTG